MKTNNSENTMIEPVKTSSERAMVEAFAVLDGIKSGDISLAQATEMSNAIGKANSAIGNIIKADLLCLAFEKRSVHQPREAIDASASGDETERRATNP